MRKVIHIDMDAFFASVEQRNNPELRGRPVVVGGRPGKRGVVAAASYEARRFGVRSAMPSTRAAKLCPQAIFVPPHFDLYREVSQQIRAIFLEYTSLVEPLSLDEAYLDVTVNSRNNPSATLVANEIRARILETTGLTASAGVAPNKFLAKVASDINKPNGIFVIPPDHVLPFIAALEIGRFYGIGKATEKKMHQLGIFNGADLRAREEPELVRHFGKMGAYYYRIARGIDERPVSPHRVRKSVGVEETFVHDLTSSEQMTRCLLGQAKEVARRLEKAGLAGKTITIKLRFHDFETITRGQTVGDFVCDRQVIYETARGLLARSGAEEKRIRLIGITVSNLNNQQEEAIGGAVQLPLPFHID